MAETQEASVGYMGEVWLHDGSALYELRQVKSFGLPTYEREKADATHLKSPGWRRQYISTFYADSEFEVVLNFRPLSTTDTLLRAALDEGDTRAMKLVFPENGVPAAQVELTAKLSGYAPGEITADGVMEATATFLVETINNIAAYAA
jgi:hypothetical protein